MNHGKRGIHGRGEGQDRPGIMNSELRIMNCAAGREVRWLELVIAGICEGNVVRGGVVNFCAAFSEYPAIFWNFRYLGADGTEERRFALGGTR